MWSSNSSSGGHHRGKLGFLWLFPIAWVVLIISRYWFVYPLVWLHFSQLLCFLWWLGMIDNSVLLWLYVATLGKFNIWGAYSWPWSTTDIWLGFGILWVLAAMHLVLIWLVVCIWQCLFSRFTCDCWSILDLLSSMVVFGSSTFSAEEIAFIQWFMA